MRSRFGSRSLYYRMYRRNPAQARQVLWAAYNRLGQRVRMTAREFKCSTNTIYALLTRRPHWPGTSWDNRSTGSVKEKEQNPMPKKRSQTTIGVLSPSALVRWEYPRVKSSVKVFLLKKNPGK